MANLVNLITNPQPPLAISKAAEHSRRASVLEGGCALPLSLRICSLLACWSFLSFPAPVLSQSLTFNTLAGYSGHGSIDARGSAARFNIPWGIAADTTGNLYVADMQNHTIRKITPAGDASTLAGLTGISGSADGTNTNARFSQPCSVAVDTSGTLYVADTGNHTIRKITSAGVVSTFAGLPGVSGTNNGTGPNARFYQPEGVAVDASGNVYVADTWNHSIRKITLAAGV